jgi:hypothetical protein
LSDNTKYKDSKSQKILLKKKSILIYFFKSIFSISKGTTNKKTDLKKTIFELKNKQKAALFLI